MSARFLVVPLLVVVGVSGLIAWAARSPVEPVRPAQISENGASGLTDSIAKVDDYFASRWQNAGIDPANPASDLLVLRRLMLALMGTVPSLEEIREFEADAGADRLARWTDRILNDSRFFDYFGVRLSRALVGAEQGQFIVFRRDRFNTWLAEQLKADRPYNEMVRDMIAARGLWTSEPASNFITAGVVDEVVSPNKLAGRTVRVFLGQRIDCAECHDHPNGVWKQAEFEGLAACFGQTATSLVGLRNVSDKKFEVQDRSTLQNRVVEPAVPFVEEAWTDEGALRERLATWVIDPANRRFERAIANRVWGLMFGKPWVAPVDDLPDPPQEGEPQDLLDLLGQDFREHGYSLRRMIAVIAGSRLFRLESRHPLVDEGGDAEVVDQAWAMFPMVRLRPEQIIGGMLQASSVKTIDQNSHLVSRFLRLVREVDFVREYGDYGEDELGDHSGTIPQALLRMNGEFVRETSAATPFTASGRISGMAPSNEVCLETAYLCVVTRRPTAAEAAYFLPLLEASSKNERSGVVEDIFWSLLNSPEFCWGH